MDVVAESGTVADARNAGLRTALLVVVIGLVAAWFFLPRSDVAAGPTSGEVAAGGPVRLKIKAAGGPAAPSRAPDRARPC